MVPPQCSESSIPMQFKNVSTGHSYQLKKNPQTYMKRNSLKSELQGEGRKESYQERSEMKSTQSTEAVNSADKPVVLVTALAPQNSAQLEMLCKASSAERWAATVEAETGRHWQHMPRSHQKGAVNGKPLQRLLAGVPRWLGIKKNAQKSLIHGEKTSPCPRRPGFTHCSPSVATCSRLWCCSLQ